MPYELSQLITQENDFLQYIDRDNDLFVIEMKRLEHLQAKGIYNEVLNPLNVTAAWAREFLCKPHNDLGRKGAVCPFTKPAIEKELFWLSLYTQPSPTQAGISEVMLRYRDLFFRLEPQIGREAQYKTILVVFPHIQPEDYQTLIDDVQEQLKPQFVSQGLMIGQFHANCQQGGLWNPEFKALQSPLPMLVIRNMVVSDYPFLEHHAEFVRAWTEQFPNTYEHYLKNTRG
jgi:hypothetical protein